MDAYQLTISNENEAWNLLLDAINDRLPKGMLDIKFEGWPILQVKLNGDIFQSSLTTKMMESFIDLQKDIYRGYAGIFYNRQSGKVLTDIDKRALEIIVKVGPGSTDLKAVLEKAAGAFIKGAIQKMDAKHYVIIAVAAGLLWTGNSAWRSYLDNQVSIKNLEVQQFSTQQDLERMRILAGVLDREPVLIPVMEDSIEFYNKVLKGATRADSIEVAGRQIPKVVTEKLVRPVRERSAELQLNGECRILSVDSSKADFFNVEVRFEDGRTFTARLEEGLVAENDKKKSLLQNAEWGKSPVYLRMNGRELRGDITQAVILDVEPIPQK